MYIKLGQEDYDAIAEIIADMDDECNGVVEYCDLVEIDFVFTEGIEDVGCDLTFYCKVCTWVFPSSHISSYTFRPRVSCLRLPSNVILLYSHMSWLSVLNLSYAVYCCPSSRAGLPLHVCVITPSPAFILSSRTVAMYSA